MNDHKADAEGLLGVQWRDDFALAQLAEAQVHATLYLAEQQRIANLIALADHAHSRFGNYAGAAGGMGTLLSHPEHEGGNMRIRDDIAVALGIGIGIGAEVVA